MYTTPPETTAPFSSTSGALECHRSVRGSARVSPCDPVFPALPRELDHSEAIAGVPDISSPGTTTARQDILVIDFLAVDLDDVVPSSATRLSAGGPPSRSPRRRLSVRIDLNTYVRPF
jgi:hypothetical protein